ncbi:YggS family pyridoxal phosphate-dependent enzyme [Leekyejoonella antrihumi]|uniref:Pyridoxal phosphate homeostasis protein n=1 Tax=Leekyejoonella antrihumi TaxID=1660198 RepID=A0A563DY47_9MICO|nr:YggS family pyridoxal phosphate-dependent enzyme [Leekyejoonella antrihumi]TWP35180.1 YggS family pyridoxal phosphate-dependent enzyme [Leekyejoonella antrihumi]
MPDDDRTRALAHGLQRVEERIAAACEQAGRTREEVRLIVVTKFFPAADVLRLHALGVTDIGENRHQEASAKIAELPSAARRDLTVHFIGQLQSNKAAHVVGYADVVQSVDRTKVVRALDRAAAAAGRECTVLLQVDLAGDDTGRGGAAPAELSDLAAAAGRAEHLRLQGVMAVAPLGGNAREAFERLRRIANEVRVNHPLATWISAGMSGDLEDAVLAGATHLRVGSAILGSRPPQR